MGMQLEGFLLVIMFLVVGALSVLGSPVPVAPSPSRMPQEPPTASPIRPSQQPSVQPDPAFYSKQAPSNLGRGRHGNKGVTPSYKASHISSSWGQSPTKVVAPHPHHAVRPSSIALAPSISSFGTPAHEWAHRPAYSPSISNHRHHGRGRNHVKIPESSYRIPPPEYNPLGPSASPFPSMSWESPVPALSPASNFTMRSHSPAMSPFDPSLKKLKAPPPLQILTLPPPPPNEDCASLTCSEPLTYTPAGSRCGCVWPIQVKLRFRVAIYTFFTLVTELAEEIAASVALNHSQVRIMGANAASQELEKSTVLINLVPRGVKFDDSSAFSIYKKFWNRQVLIKPSLFGAYEVLYVRYPGLPPSPPSLESTSTVDDGPYTGHDNNGRTNKPLGVDVPRRKNKGLGGSMVAVIVLSSFTVLVICMAIAWLLLLKCGTQVHEPQHVLQELESSPVKGSGATGPTIFGSMPTSESMSLSSGAMAYTGSAKTFTLNDIERATNSFDASRILGEGGFGLVYSGLLDDGREVAVKVLKRDDQHGGREFLAEVEMLSRLHHRNLVKLVGICTEGHTRCLVYELIPNGSVESYLHGVDQETDPLDWDARMKIALGAARGLAYLHEDSSPSVIHRDFKSSNILLEPDFTPKVSDFGLAKAAVDGGNKHISTHIMGTFGYLAPEYAMMGHLLVKSDVYSYGVVLLELLTGRKPVDLSQPPGQENLVVYARPLLTCKEGLEAIVDPTIRSSVSFDTITKVAAIASMCVQPEVSHRPFMGEVVQALKLVCNEFDEANMQRSRSCSHENLIDLECKDEVSGENMESSQPPHPVPLSKSDLLTTSMGFEGQEFGSFRRHASAGTLRIGRRHFWQRLRNLSRGTMSEHEFSLKLWP
ncbi:PREDICTED: receptor-like serine/threonine-protein kinase ALE2 isoform X1 [Populus euphratica]|uniref:Receptor-like serine/threonine-protein kinase ALE2 isoform X1 n=1 Tax=Populus euphratica TaxID=75702 RepID=A0AAJ6SXK3_POPEU|nr:PREDICTED: receptor-like serine/threonine-protein kinase ALE2 isoform X1 [Populus euphratica]